MIAEKLQPLVGRPAIARALERLNVVKRAIAQRQILEAIADTLFKSAAAPARPALLAVGRCGGLLFGSGFGLSG